MDYNFYTKVTNIPVNKKDDKISDQNFLQI